MGIRSIIGIVCLLGLLVVVYLISDLKEPTPSIEEPSLTPSRSSAPITAELLPGEALLEGYGLETSTVQEDLQKVQRVLMAVRTLVKTQDPGRMAVNEDVVEVLLGRNPYKQRFLPDKHPTINANGQLIDRWASPLFFHLEAADRLDIRSAGPDKQLFTDDDVHLHADGAFMPPEKLSGRSIH